MTRLGRLVLLFGAVATAVTLAAVPMTWPAESVLVAWAAAVGIAVGLAMLVDEFAWRTRDRVVGRR